MSSQGPSSAPPASSPPDFHEADRSEHKGNAAAGAPSSGPVSTPADGAPQPGGPYGWSDADLREDRWMTEVEEKQDVLDFDPGARLTQKQIYDKASELRREGYFDQSLGATPATPSETPATPSETPASPSEHRQDLKTPAIPPANSQTAARPPSSGFDHQADAREHATGAPPRNQAENRPARHSFDKGRLARETADIEAGHATRAEVKNVQRELNREGGHLREDGIAGKQTLGAIKLKRSGLLPKP